MPKRKQHPISKSENISKYFCGAINNAKKCGSLSVSNEISNVNVGSAHVDFIQSKDAPNSEGNFQDSDVNCLQLSAATCFENEATLGANTAVEDGLPKKTYNFQQSWKTGRNWLLCENKAMFCSICQAYDKGPRVNAFRDGGCYTLRKRMVEQHEKSNAHQNAFAASRKKELGPLQKTVLKLEAKEVKQLHHLFKIAFHIGKQEMPFSAFRDEIRLLRSVGVDISETYNNDKQASTFISFITEEIRASLEKSNFFSIMADGSTDRGTCEEEIIYINFLENGEVVTKFVTLQPLKTADANGIQNAISDTMLNCLGLSENDAKSKLVACALDGTPTNFGEKNGAFQKLKRDGRPHLLGIHCCAHRLELAVKDVVEKSAYYLKFEESLNDLYVIYKYSAKNWSELQTVGEALNIKILKPIKVGGIRWIAHHERAAIVVHKCYRAYIIHLESLSQAKSKKYSSRAANAIKNMKSLEFVLFLQFFLVLLNLLSSLSKILQRNCTNLTYARSKIRAILHTFKKLKNESTLEKFADLDDIKDLSISDENIMYRGINLSEIKLKTRKIRSSEYDVSFCIIKAKVLKEAKHIVELCGNFIRTRFENFIDDPVLSAFKVFEPSNWPVEGKTELNDYGQEEIKLLWSHFGHILQEKGLSKTEALLQWEILKHQVKDTFGQRIKCQKYSHVWKNIMTSDDRNYNDILCLIEIGLVIPVNTAECERGFSLMGRIKSDWRSKLKPAMLTNLMHLSLSKETLETFNPENAIHRWWKAGQRIRRTNIKPYGPRSKAVSETTEHSKSSSDSDVDSFSLESGSD